MILTGCRFVSKKQVELSLGHLGGTRLGLHPSPAVDLDELHLSTPQRALLDRLDRPRSLTELSAATDATFADASRFVFALMAMELLLPEETLARIEVTPQLPLTRPVPGLAREAPKEFDAAAVANEVMTTYLRHRRVDARGLLGIPADTPPELVKESFLAYCHRFAPWRFQHPELLSLADKAEELFLAGVAAYARLTAVVPSGRPAAPEATVTASRSMKITRRAADELAIDTAPVDPEEYFEKGRSHLAAGRYVRALSALEMASDCDPQNALYRAEAAYCYYRSSPEATAAEEAAERLLEAIRIDKTCGLTVFYYGEVQRQSGQLDEAERYLRRAIKMLAPDNRPVESMRELVRARRQAGGA